MPAQTFGFGDDEAVPEDEPVRLSRQSLASSRSRPTPASSAGGLPEPRVAPPPAWAEALADAGAVPSASASLAEPPAPEPAASTDFSLRTGAAKSAVDAPAAVIDAGEVARRSSANVPKHAGTSAAHRVTLRLRSFAAGKRFPHARARIFARVRLPASLYALRAGAASGTGVASRVSVDASGANVHTTRPAVEVSRAGTADSMAGAAIPLENANCQVIVHSPAEVLARTLAEDSVAIVEIWMRDDDVTLGPKERVLGTARVPLSELAEEAWIDCAVPVYAGGDSRNGGGGGAATALVQIGMLKLSMSLEMRHAPGARWSRASVPRRQPAPAPAATAGRAEAPGPDEYRAAFELETWKRAEQSKFLEHLAASERMRMAQLEAAWIENEERREAQVATIRAEHAALESKLQASIERAETRERLLASAEEAIQRKRRDEERDQALRAAEAQAAVRRLQEECEHQLSIEAQRFTELSERHAASTSRASELESRLAAAERELSECKRALHSPENDAGQLRVRVTLLEERNATLVAREAASAQTVQRLKARVVKLAKALQHVARQRAELSERRVAEEWTRLQSYALAVRADATAANTARDRHAYDEVDHVLAEAEAEMQSGRGGGGGDSGGGGGPAAGASAPPPEEDGAMEGLSDVRLASSRPPPPVVARGVPPLALPPPDPGQRASQLAAERAALLATGAYAPSDPLILALDAALHALPSSAASP